MAAIDVPVFYACDESFLKFAAVSICSLKANASKARDYTIHVLHSGIPDEAKKVLSEFDGFGFRIVFDDVSDYLANLSEDLPCAIIIQRRRTTVFSFPICSLNTTKHCISTPIP